MVLALTVGAKNCRWRHQLSATFLIISYSIYMTNQQVIKLDRKHRYIFCLIWVWDHFERGLINVLSQNFDVSFIVQIEILTSKRIELHHTFYTTFTTKCLLCLLFLLVFLLETFKTDWLCALKEKSELRWWLHFSCRNFHFQSNTKAGIIILWRIFYQLWFASAVIAIIVFYYLRRISYTAQILFKNIISILDWLDW